jgi:hypothetical protein
VAAVSARTTRDAVQGLATPTAANQEKMLTLNTMVYHTRNQSVE